MLKKILGAILATSMLFSTNVFAEEFSTQPMFRQVALGIWR